MILIFLGPPGSGKGTQAKKLAEKIGLPHIALGDILRETIREGGEMGRQIKEFVENGKLVPDEITIEITRARISRDDCRNGFILDGFPRSLAQAEALLGMLNGRDYKVVYFKVPLQLVIERNSGRLSCGNCGAVFHEKFNPPKKDEICDRCGEKLYKRADDNEDIIKTRFMVYEEKTAPVLDFYEKKGSMITINAAGSIDEVFERLLKALGV